MSPQTRAPIDARNDHNTDIGARPGTELMVRSGDTDVHQLVVGQPGRFERIATSPAVAAAISAGRPVTRAALWSTRRVGAQAPTIGRLAGRYASGQLLNGESRTDATFWRRGRKPYPHVEGETGGWSYLCGAQRSAARFCATSIAWTTCYEFWPTATLTATYSAGAAATALGAWGVHQWWCNRAHRRKYLEPLHAALKAEVPTAVPATARRPEDWLHIPQDFKTRLGAEVRIDLPQHFSGVEGVKTRIKNVVCAKLGLPSDVIANFPAEGDKPYAVFREPQRAPQSVSLADIMPFLLKSRDTAPIIGLAAGLEPVMVDLMNDSPHVLISGGTGSGKSVLLRAILAQGLAKGGYGIILDVKKVSHMWTRNIDNVKYHRSAESIHDQLLKLQEEVDWRTEIVLEKAKDDGNTDHIDVGPRIFVLAEEMNATINRLQAYWRRIKDKNEPNMSPAVEALQDLLFMGRQIKIHVLAVAQMASAKSMGGPEARENFATRCLARYTNNAWKMLVPEIWPPPKKSTVTGRWQVVNAGVATETQVVYLTPRQARKLAIAGLPDTAASSSDTPSAPPEPAAPARAGEGSDAPPWEDASQVSKPSQAGVDQANAPSNVEGDPSQRPRRLYAVSGGGDTRAVDNLDAPDRWGESAGHGQVVPGQRLVSLSEAIAEGLIPDGVSIHQLRKWRERDPHFPKHAGPEPKRAGKEQLFDADELGRYARNRKTNEPDESVS